MKSVFDKTTMDELTARIGALSPEHKNQWGKMNVFEMVKHCASCDDMYHGKIKIKRSFIGRLIGSSFLKKFAREGQVFDRNSPTAPALKHSLTAGDLAQLKGEWIDRVGQYAHYNNPDFVHPFFGPMTKEQVGIMAYKHADHHLRQFGA